MTQLSENSNVKLGLVGGFLAAVIAITWWAAALQTKVDSLIQMTTGNVANVASMKDEIAQIHNRLNALERKP